MTGNTAPEASLRQDRLEISRLAWAFGLSVAVHLLVWGTYKLGDRFHVWQRIQMPAWIERLIQPPREFAQLKQEQTNREPPLMFVDVNPAVAVTEPPEDAPFYSDKNSKAANPEMDQETGAPKITGEQPQVPKAEDVKRNPFDQLMPTPAPQADQTQEEIRPKTKFEPGDLTLSKPDTETKNDTGDAEKRRPRTIQEARARNQIVGPKMKQEGGVRPQRLEASFDAKATAFGAYDRALIDAVSSRWYDLLDNISFDGYRRGHVVLQFHLNYDGRITDMKVLENTVTDSLGLLCEKAVLDPAPFDKWPREMRIQVGRDHREIKFTFYYN